MKFVYILLISIAFLYSNTTKINKVNDLSISIYNNDIAMINELRQMHLKQTGKQKLIYEGIASKVIHESIIPSFSKKTVLYSQNYHYDILSLDKLLQKSLNTMIIYKKQISDYKYEKQKAKLLALNPIMVRKDNKIISGIKKTDIIFSKIPEDLITKPSLIWNTNSLKGEQKININYLTRGISWKSDYILNIDKQNSLNGWISINNNSGASYKNANIYCIAGDIKTNTITPQRSYSKNILMLSESSSPRIKQRSFAGYHLYKIPFKETINNNEKKQINFINKKNIKISSIAKSQNSIYFHRFSKMKAKKFKHIIKLSNTKKDGLGLALPKGVIRVYKKDENISHFVGQDNIKHTSLGENISLYIGDFFDIRQDIVQMQEKRTKSFVQSKYKRDIQNKSKKIRIIEIIENNYSSNVKDIILKHNCKDNCTYTKEDLNTYKYKIRLSPNSKYELITNYKLIYQIKQK